MLPVSIAAGSCDPSVRGNGTACRPSCSPSSPGRRHRHRTFSLPHFFRCRGLPVLVFFPSDPSAWNSSYRAFPASASAASVFCPAPHRIPVWKYQTSSDPDHSSTVRFPGNPVLLPDPPLP